MATFKKFEDIEAWQRARELTREVYRVTGEGAFARDLALRDQIRRACISVMSNIAEGFGRSGNWANHRWIDHLSEANELEGGQVQTNSELRTMNSRTPLDETGRALTGLMNYLRRIKIKGSKYK